MICASLIVVVSCFAQPADVRDRLYFGIKAGYNYSNIYDTEIATIKTSSDLGISAGFFASIPFGKSLGLQSEILISQRGFKGTGNLFGSAYQLTRTSTYIDLPMLPSWKATKHFTLMAGPQFSYTIKHKDIFTPTPTSPQQSEVFRKDHIRRTIFCLLTGLDINLHPVVVGIRAGWDLQNNSAAGSSTTPRYKNIWLQGTIGMRF